MSSPEERHRAERIQSDMDKIDDALVGAGSIVLAAIIIGLALGLLWWWARLIL